MVDEIVAKIGSSPATDDSRMNTTKYADCIIEK